MVLVKRRQIETAQTVRSRYVRSAEQLREMSFAALFGNNHSVEIEVGFGKGLFLQSAAKSNPRINYLGIEVSDKCLALTAHRLDRFDVEQVRLVLGDARYIFSHFIQSSSAQAVHTYFPDPWWKRRHRKRRLYRGDFVRDVERVLVPGGELHVWTDVEEYFLEIEETVARCTRLRRLAPPVPRAAAHDMDYHTHFERKMRRTGRNIYRARYARDVACSRFFLTRGTDSA